MDVRKTAKASLAIQCISLLISLGGFAPFIFSNYSVQNALFTALVLEVAAQIIELAWYWYFVYTNKDIDIKYRYYDWAFSTPIMLISFVLILEYFQDQQVSVHTAMSENWLRLLLILILNYAMLGMGYWYLSLKREILLLIGFFPFVIEFLIIYAYCAKQTMAGLLLWVFMFFTWALYGIAVALGSKSDREVFLNILDILSKNVFGILITVVILVET